MRGVIITALLLMAAQASAGERRRASYQRPARQRARSHLLDSEQHRHQLSAGQFALAGQCNAP